ncbi:MAG: PLP-dependent transferase [Spirochaetaceae bacterium]|jgi:cystathionine beta-lyase/cystathionine gamma-synthase|nr:PLP-dependent transferase [Spirochaetaceae bacterium]
MKDKNFATKAVHTGVLHLLKIGDHVIAGNDIYGGTYRLFDSVFRNMGVDTTFVDMGNPDNVKNNIRPNTKLIWIETPSIPLMNIVDIQAVADVSNVKPFPLVCVDNTVYDIHKLFEKPLFICLGRIIGNRRY